SPQAEPRVIVIQSSENPDCAEVSHSEIKPKLELPSNIPSKLQAITQQRGQVTTVNNNFHYHCGVVHRK
ncbi:unnamed protein product, partial [Prunus brigantina]